ERAGAAGARVITTYGMTETCGGAVYDGVALEGAQVKLSSEGEIALRGPMLMRSYRARAELSARALQEGWFHTADLGEIDADGRLRVLGRRDGLILTGAELVAPLEVEAVLREHPQVARVRVMAAPDPEWGERVVAMVVPAAGVDPPDLQSLRSFALERLAAHKVPRELVLIEKPAPSGNSAGGHPPAPSPPYNWQQRR
ncbi:MAG: class I adenylate-forming enzyme family protein, partial [Actinomycetota bacterium]